MKSLLSRILLVILILGTTGIYQIQASCLDSFLKRTEQKFNKASSREAKKEVVSQVVNLDYLLELKSIEELDEQLLTSRIFLGRERTNQITPLGFAVARGNRFLVEKFLSVVEDVNSPTFITQGYRQLFSLAHLALGPLYPQSKETKVPLQARLEIIDELGKKGADFNALRSEGIYRNPPLTAGAASGYHVKDEDSLRARALLYGADPELRGTSFSGVELYPDLMNKVLDYSVELSQKGIALRPVESVRKKLKETKEEKIKALISLNF